MSSEQPIIKIDKVSKRFNMNGESYSSLKQAALNLGRRKKKRTHMALKDISFEVGKGEFFGIVGRNGSGKSTLLKIMAQVYRPSTGQVTVNGSLVPFIELGVGFNPELSGRDNVFLNGALLGFSRKAMNNLYDDIVEFAELEEFMDQKLKNYSSGMQVRLAFSIAIRADSDILLIDEVLAVGDSSFQRKCFDYFANLKDDKKTVVFISHDMDAIQRFCDRAALIDNGKMLEIGSTEKITDLYHEKNIAIKQKQTVPQEDQGDGSAEITSLAAYVNDKQNKHFTDEAKTVSLKLEIRAKLDIDEDLLFGFTIKRQGSGDVFWTNTEWTETALGSLKKLDRLKLQVDIDNVFAEGNYDIEVALRNKLKNKTFTRRRYTNVFQVTRKKKNKWLMQPAHSIKRIN